MAGAHSTVHNGFPWALRLVIAGFSAVAATVLWASPSSSAYVSVSFIETGERNDTSSTVGAIGSPPNNFTVRIGECFDCDMRSLACLPPRPCMRAFMEDTEARVALGVAARLKFKEKLRWVNDRSFMLTVPIGKYFLYSTIRAWRRWALFGTVPREFRLSLTSSLDLVSERYPYCRSRNITGTSCMFHEFPHEEDLGTFERQAVSRAHVSKEATDKVMDNLSSVYPLAQNYGRIPADLYLMSFAYFARMFFNRRDSMIAVYKERVAVINPGRGVLRVALHMRRADACSQKQRVLKPSPLDEVAQISSQRLCYDTSVYVDQLKRLQVMYKEPLEVYLATDESYSVLGEIRQIDPSFFANTTWTFTNYSRSEFKYRGFVESPENTQRAFLTETALSDLWHLSHGSVLVGHLGSAYGKLAYLLAAARQNSPIPYVSVDGHSICCENDEQCSWATGMLKSLLDCLLYRHELVYPRPIPGYWVNGSRVRQEWARFETWMNLPKGLKKVR